MEGFGIILFLVAIIVSIFDKAGRGGTRPPGRQQQPPRQRPAPRPRYGPSPEPPALPRGTVESGEGKAADMVPEDFWRELTGQARRPVPVERHEPEALPPADLPSWDEEAVARVEAEMREVPVREERSLEEYRRPDVIRREPVIVSLETTPLPPEVRHSRFHQREEERRAREAPRPVVKVPAHPLYRRVRNRATLREGFVLQEVLGRPKGLEDDDEF